jgi:hypothetical protein
MIRPRGPGDPMTIRASEWRSIASACEFTEAARRSGRPDGVPSVARTSSTLRVRNSSGADLSIGHVVSIEAPLFTSADNLEGFKRQLAMVASAPSASSRGRIAIATEPIADGAIGRVIVSGIAVARLDVVDRNAWAAAPIVGETDRLQLVSRGPVEVLHRNAGDSGTVWAVIRIGASVTAAEWMVASAALIAGSSPSRWKYTIQRGTRNATTGEVTVEATGEVAYAYNDWENPTGWGHGQSLSPAGGMTLTPLPVEGPVPATFTGLYDPVDGKAIYRFDVACPMTSACAGTDDGGGGLTQEQVEGLLGSD